MRTRALLLVALVVLPSTASAQRLPRPPIGRRPTPEPAPLPPQAGPVARSLALKRSRWSVEGYSLVSQFQVPQPGGGATGYASLGTGTHLDYRYTDHWSASVDLTASLIGSPARAETAELGTRYSPLSWEQALRPYFDLRAGYMHMFDPFSFASLGDPAPAGATSAARYTRGFGGVTGTGFEYSLTRSFALTAGLSVMRSRMSTYRITPGTIQNGTSFWMTTVRYTLGFKFNPITSLQYAQPRR